MKFLKANLHLFIFILLIGGFSYPFIFSGKLPIPSDALVGLYHPWRDSLQGSFPNGYPYKNPLITDPVRQQYPYRILAINDLKQGQLPKWNPYNFSGTPLMANIQTAAFYPLNILFWLLPDASAWSILVLLQPILAGVFMYLYLKNLRLVESAAVLGGISFAFSGFMVAWLTWNTIGHVALWLPLILLAKDKLLEKFRWRWGLVLVFAESAMLLAGHLQTAFYVVVFSTIYLILRAWRLSNTNLRETWRKLTPFIFTALAVMLLVSGQFIPTVRFILASARNFDLPDWQRPEWFLPVGHLIQFIAPDFFGNPATGNYWGYWNYGEFVGYIGILPLMLGIFAGLFRRDKKTLFYSSCLVSALILALPTPLAKIPYQLNLPLIATLQPSRIIFLVDFCFAVLAALGMDHLLKQNQATARNLQRIIVDLALVFGFLWLFVIFARNLGVSPEKALKLVTSKRNLVLPSVVFIAVSGCLWLLHSVKNHARQIMVLLLVGITAWELWHFANKFTPFTDQNLLFPQAPTLNFLKANLGNYRLLTTDRRILPPNVTTYYRLASVDGYDPLYLANYGELMAAWTRNSPDITPGAFNRILTPEDPNTFFADLLGVKYVISLKEETDPKLKLVFQEGETRVYENSQVFPRAFLAEKVYQWPNRETLIKDMFFNQSQLRNVAFTTADIKLPANPLVSDETAEIVSYSENNIIIKTKTTHERLLVLTDIYYPEWQAFIDGQKTQIYPVDLSLRGIVVSQGEHLIELQI